MKIKILWKDECGLKDYDNSSDIRGKFRITKGKDNFSFCAIGGKYREVASDKELRNLLPGKNNEFDIEGFFGIFPKEKTVVFYGHKESLYTSFKKEDVWPIVINLVKKGIVSHAFIDASDSYRFSEELVSNPALRTVLKKYDCEPAFSNRTFGFIKNFLFFDNLFFSNIPKE